MGEPSGGDGVAATAGAALVALIVLVVVLWVVHLSGGVQRQVRTVDLSPRERAAAEQLVAPRRQAPPVRG